MAAAVTLITAEDTDKEVERIKTVEGAAPLAAAIAADAVAHSIPGLNILLQLLAEPTGAAAGVAYMMTLVLSAPAVDPSTLAPKGTVLNAEKANDARAAVRVPFTRIIPTALKVVDFSNDASSGAGWTIGESGLPNAARDKRPGSRGCGRPYPGGCFTRTRPVAVHAPRAVRGRLARSCRLPARQAGGQHHQQQQHQLLNELQRESSS